MRLDRLRNPDSRALPCAAAVLGLGGGLPGCDLGSPHVDSGVGPALHVIATYPKSGQGEECGLDASDDCGVPVDGPIELRFDRYLLPKTANRQAISVYTGTLANGSFLTPRYDVLERVVTYRPAFGSQFVPGVVYQVKIVLPKDDPSGAGFRAFDGAELEPGPMELSFSFRTSRKARPPQPAGASPTCDGAVRVLTEAGCADCHAGKRDSPFGLSLGSTDGLRDTAIGQVAHQASNWAIPGSAVADAPRFGTGMALIDAGDPAASYLVYKLLENPHNFAESTDGPCSTTHLVRMPRGVCPLAPVAERNRLAAWFVEGDPMPPDASGLPNGLADLRTLTAFIETVTDLCN
jgi:hypothetical protein